MVNTLDKSTKKNALLFIFACYFLYLISISIKMVYSAEMAEIVSTSGAQKSQVSLGLTFYYVSYTIGQLALSIVIKRINMKWFMAFSVFAYALSFGLVPVFDSLWGLYVIMFLNGFFQTGVWGGIMYFVGKYIPKQLSSFTAAFLGTGLALGTALTYGMSALFIAVWNWQSTFLFFAILSAVSVVVFLISLKSAQKKLSHVEIENRAHEQAAKEQELASQVNGENRHPFLWLILILILTAITISSVYYAFMGWFPTLLIDGFKMPTEYSLLLTLLLPAATTPSSFLVNNVAEKSKSHFFTPLLFMAFPSVILIALCFCYSFDMILTLVLAVIMLFFLRGIMNLVCSYFPLKLKDKINSGKLSLIINAFASLMAGVMPFISAIIMEQVGWTWYFIFMAALTVITVLIFIVGRIFEVRHDKKNLPVADENL